MTELHQAEAATLVRLSRRANSFLDLVCRLRLRPSQSYRERAGRLLVLFEGQRSNRLCFGESEVVFGV
jgi:hypothetical protein